MSYHLHQTEAFVLGARDQGEASSDVDLFTAQVGLVTARAQGVRLLKSKLRYHLEPLTLVQVNLIRGREVWRLVGAEKILVTNLSGLNRNFLAKIFQLLARLAPPEAESTPLFSELKDGLDRATGLKSETELSDLLLQLSALILTRFGYGDEKLWASSTPQELATFIDQSLHFSQL